MLKARKMRGSRFRRSEAEVAVGIDLLCDFEKLVRGSAGFNHGEVGRLSG